MGGILPQGSHRAEASVQQGLSILAINVRHNRGSRLALASVVARPSIPKALAPTNGPRSHVQRGLGNASGNGRQLCQFLARRIRIPYVPNSTSIPIT
jgi:hypothetical protein